MKALLCSKKIIAIICAFSVAVVGGLAAIVFVQYKNYEKENLLKETAIVAEITEAFHDQGDVYMSPVEPDKNDDVTLRLRCDRYNVSKAHIQYTLDKGQNWSVVEMKYDKRDKTGYYDMWVGTIPAQTEPYFYRFAVANESKGATMYLGTQGVRSNQIDIDEMFYVIPGFKTPDWSKGNLWYYAHLGQFYNGDTTNDLLREGLLCDSAYGNDRLSMRRGTGDIKGLIEKLDYIEDLGAETIAVGPFFSSSESLGFGIDNMAAVETAFGTEQDLIKLISEVHSREMKITTDMIVSYLSAYSKYFNAQRTFPEDGAYISENSIYSPLFKFPLWPDNFVKIWNSVGIDAANPNAADIFYKNEDSLVLKYLNNPYGLDGYRFDAEESVGNTGFDYDPDTIWKNIIGSIKSTSEDILVLSENCVGIADQYNTLFDSSWQKNGYFAMRDWFVGSKKCSEMMEILQDNLVNTARPRALSSYNFLGQHDVVRLWEDTEEQRNDIKALLLLQMTFIGSPVIYYGDEIGLTCGLNSDQTASPFNWDESQWDYSIYNMVKSLGNLRKEYSCLKTGAICIGEIDDSQQFLSFGRFDSKGSVITLCNKQGITVEKEIRVNRFAVKDGSILTDFYSGREYKVKDGKVTVKVIPGGTLLVTGGQTSDIKNQFCISKIGGSSKIYQDSEADFEITGKGKLESQKDKFVFLNTNLYNAGFISTKIQANNSQGGIMLRNHNEEDSAYYAAVVSGEKIIICARASDKAKKEIVKEISASSDIELKLLRSANNKFSAYFREKDNTDWQLIEGSEVTIGMNEAIKSGAFVLKGNCEFNGLSSQSIEESIFDSFDGENLNALFSDNGNDEYKISNGILTLSSKDDNTSALNSNAHSSDWTFKTKINSFKNESEELSLAGVRSYFNDDDYVVAARGIYKGEKSVILGKMVGGKLMPVAITEDQEPEKEIVVQLQRIGSYYSAVYSYDSENWKNIGGKLYCNYTGMRAGVFTHNATSDFDYAGFGNSINDNKSTNTPITTTEIYTGFDRYLTDVELDKMAYLGESDGWSDIGAGYKQTNEKGQYYLYCSNKLFDDFKAEVTLNPEKGTGDAGVIFAKEDYSTDFNDCYKLSVDTDGELSLTKNGNEIISAKVDVPEEGIRLVIRRENDFINVFTGEESELILTAQTKDFSKGYIAFYTNDCTASFINYDITPLESDWIIRDVVFGTDGIIEMVNANSAWLAGVGVTNGAVGATINYTAKSTATEKTDDRLGFLIGGNSERLPEYGGVFIYYSKKTGMLSATEYGKELATAKLAEPNELEIVKLLVIFESGKYKVYANNSEKSLLEFEASTLNGGSIGLVCYSGNSHFVNLNVKDFSTGITSGDILSQWRSTNVETEYSTDMLLPDGKDYSDDFENYKGWNQNFYRMIGNEASWYIDNGTLRFDNATKNWNLATITNGVYRNASVETKVKFNTTVSSSLFSLSLCKQDVYAGSFDTGYSVRVYGDGRVYVFDAKQNKVLNGYNTSISNVKEWFTIKTEMLGGVLKVYLDGKEIFKGKCNSYNSGYIALQCDYSAIEIDEINIKSLEK